ncbi:MAG: SHOCT domain-containing protein [Desulfuromonadales bacterium]|nr:SHOCT domain-containing protein [Desulfuromonadales bacterium]
MTETHRITPGRVPRTGALFGIVLSALFLIFGGFFCYQAVQNIFSGEMSLGIVLSLFSLIWIVGCIAILVNFTRIYKACDSSPDNQFVKIESLRTSEGQETGQDFNARLRKLESLYQDGLVTEVEYNAKRSELLEEKW